MTTAAAEKPRAASSTTVRRREWLQILLITLAAAALYAGIRALPTGTNLSHMDFQAGGSELEFCDPANPQFVPVVAVRSPITMTLASAAPAVVGRETQLTLSLATASGKPIGPEDLLVVHTQKLHVLVVDPSLSDYQHLHPQPGAKPGEWLGSFEPRRAGLYRVFADFTPAATARSLYAGTDLHVQAGKSESVGSAPAEIGGTYSKAGYTFILELKKPEVKAGEPAELAFAVRSESGGPVQLQEVMGAYAHLVAFDAERSGFAHLHPDQVDLSHAPNAEAPRLNFRITIPRPGRYVIWSQVKLDAREVFAPFAIEVK